MDVKVSRKEQRVQPDGVYEVLVDDVFDLYPVYDGELIVDVEILDGQREELLDRAMWAVVKQRGGDPLEPYDAVQWAEYTLDEIPATVCLLQATAAVQAEGPGVQASYETVQNNVIFKVMLTNAA
jgi:hypothetical protein